jgi:hypothetical protein
MGDRKRSLYTEIAARLQTKEWDRSMDHVRFGIGTVWIFFTIGAAVLLGAEFISHEIHALIKHRREPEAK